MAVGSASGVIGRWDVGGVGRAFVGDFGTAVVMSALEESLRSGHCQNGQQQNDREYFSEERHGLREFRRNTTFVNPAASQERRLTSSPGPSFSWKDGR